jgi:hypothetical protein
MRAKHECFGEMRWHCFRSGTPDFDGKYKELDDFFFLPPLLCGLVRPCVIAAHMKLAQHLGVAAFFTVGSDKNLPYQAALLIQDLRPCCLSCVLRCVGPTPRPLLRC